MKPAEYEKGIATDHRLMKSALVRFAGNVDLAQEHMRRIKNMEKEIARTTKGHKEVMERYAMSVGNDANRRKARKK